MRTAILTIAAALTLAAVPATAGVKPELRLAPGESSTVVEGEIGSRDRDIYPFTGRAGQRVRLVLTSTQGNAVFDVYIPGTTYLRDEHDVWTFTGIPLRGAEAGEETTVWEGSLPRSGRYLVVVGATRMGSAYRLRLETE